MSEFNLSKTIQMLKQIPKNSPKRENETHQNKTIYLDFNQWNNCLFENCRIMIEYGMFSLVKCTFHSCGFESVNGSPAYAVLMVDKMIKESQK